MKTVWRILAILAVALIVVGALVALRQTGILAMLLPGPERTQFEAGIERGRFAPDGFERRERGWFAPDGFERDHHAEREPDARGMIDAIKNLLIIGVIITLVVGASLIARRFLRRRAPPRAEAGPLA
ncbi:MAG: hypothetical protein NZM94_14705 [Roseiflexus sp.]|nr:hypothetical protein [Roseiflexus sp.]